MMNKKPKRFLFDPIKNKILQQTRNITFDNVIAIIENGDYLAIKDHPNQQRYSHQKVYVLEIFGYCYIVPFVEKDKHTVFLKTIIPSRKMQKLYRGSKHV